MKELIDTKSEQKSQIGKKEKHIWVGFWLIAFTINLHWVVRVPISSKIKISLFSSKVWLLGPVQ